MIVSVQPHVVAQRVAEKPALPDSVPGDTASRSSPPALENRRPASIEIDRLVVETAAPLSTAAIRDGFRDAWLEHDHTGQLWSPDAFRGGLTIDLPPGVTGRELGRRLAQAILQRTCVH